MFIYFLDSKCLKYKNMHYFTLLQEERRLQAIKALLPFTHFSTNLPRKLQMHANMLISEGLQEQQRKVAICLHTLHRSANKASVQDF